VRAVGAIVLGAGILRLAFVAWAPDGLVSDADYYHGHALALMNGNGYTNADGSPAVLWMPGWPAFLAALYSVFGASVRVAQVVNALLGAATAGVVAALGARLFSPRTGWIAGVVYALWPGVLYYVAVLFSETLFSFLLATLFLLIVIAARAQVHARRWELAAGAVLLVGMWVRAEPVAFLPAIALYLAQARASWRSAAVTTGLLAAIVVVGVAPWTLRNAQAFGRFIPTSANGGSVFWEGNHAGAPGGNDLPAMLEFRARFAHLPLGEGDVERGRAGWREGLAFIRDHPGEFAAGAVRKLAVTYRGDDRAPVLIRGFEGPRRILPSHYIPAHGYLSESVMLGLQRVANAFWWGLLALVAVGLTTLRDWRPETRTLVFGVLVTWLAIHAVLIGGARFHVPEAPWLALLAAVGLERLLHAVRRQPGE